MKITAAQFRQLRRDNAKWPAVLQPVPRGDWPTDRIAGGAPRIAMLRSRAFLVQAFEEAGGVVRLSVNRTEFDERQGRWREDIAWDDLQRLKAEAGFGDRCAVEVLPPDLDVVNVANMRHIFVLPIGGSLPFVWKRAA